MSEPKFTPGPCSVHDSDGNMSIVHNNSMLTLAFMVGTDVFTCEGFDLKYAKLFAAAPEMYEALKEFRGSLFFERATEASKRKTIAAIAKAEGKEI